MRADEEGIVGQRRFDATDQRLRFADMPGHLRRIGENLLHAFVSGDAAIEGEARALHLGVDVPLEVQERLPDRVVVGVAGRRDVCLLYTSPSPRD